MLSVLKSIKKPFLSKTFSSLVHTDPIRSDQLLKSNFRGSTRIRHNIKPGEKIGDFVLNKVENFKDFDITAYTFTHEPLNFTFLHLDCEDLSNTFAIILRTPAENQKALPAITEKMILCGSDKFKIRDPFSHMIKRSLNTDMTSWIGSDYTCFPFTTTNSTDYSNLLSIYLESIFFPTLSRHDFQSEAFHLIPSPSNPSNIECKGKIWDATRVFWQSREKLFLENLRTSLFSNHYRYSVMGKPEEILKVNYEEMKEFWANKYHPSNAVLYSYGDLDLVTNLERISSFFRERDFVRKEVNYQEIYEKTKKNDVPKTIRLNGPKGLMEEQQNKFALSFLSHDTVEDKWKNVLMPILSYILYETPFSPMYKLLLESGIGNAYCLGYGYDNSTRESTFSIGLDNFLNATTDSSLLNLEKQIIDKLQELSEKGLDPDLVEMALTQIELNSKMPKTDFGTTLLSNMITILMTSDKANQMNGLEFLKVSENIEKIRRNLKKRQQIFEPLIKNTFLNNPHYIRVMMKSDQNFVSGYIEQEKNLLEITQKNMSPEELKKVELDADKLKKEQTILQTTDSLPFLQLHEIPLCIAPIPISKTSIMDIGVNWVFHKMNDITFIRMKVGLSRIPPNLLDYLDLFVSIFPMLGSKNMKFDYLNQIFAKNTTNFEVKAESFCGLDEKDQSKEVLWITMGFLDKNVEESMNAFAELISNPDFADLNNISQLINYTSSEKVNKISQNVIEYGISHSSSGINSSCLFNDKLSQTRKFCELSAQIIKELDVESIYRDVAYKLESIFDLLIRQNNIEFIINTDPENQPNLERRLQLLLNDIKFTRKNFDSIPLIPSPLLFTPSNFKHFLTTPVLKNYIFETIQIPCFTNPDFPKLRLFAELVKLYLKEELIDFGGSYSTGCFVDWNRFLTFYTFKDPHTLMSFEGFEKASSLVGEGKFSEADLHSAKLAIFSRIDRNLEPYNRGLNNLLFGLTDEIWADYRAKLLNTTKMEIMEVASKYVLERMAKSETNQIIIGSKENKLETLISRGWKIERFINQLSLNEESYQQNYENEERILYKL